MPKEPLSSILFAALEVPSGLQRQQFLEESCGADEELRSQVDALLDALPQAEGFLSSPEFSPTVIGDSNEVPSNESVLKALGRKVPQIVLDDSMVDGDPIVRPSSSELPDDNVGSRYQFQGEIARGGMGAILKGRDIDLGRNVAIKVLLEAHRKNGQVVQRFVEEAQIGGQLQHPGIAPVYQLGQFPDRRPFFTMKLVKGQTLAAILSERAQPTDERNRLLSIFEQVCQTMAYAHSRGVVHRDLKPANIMVGAFGEVQVMDWGLAKVLNSESPKPDDSMRETPPAQTVVQTVRSVGSDAAMVGTDAVAAGETQMGSVLGTPAYMPPEQALGEVDRLDERCDVFGLGSILVEILTGKPAYASDDPMQLLRMASRGKLDDCFSRLEDSGADRDLIGIARQCLGPEPEDRPRNADEVADHITAYLESVEARLRQAELKRATDATRTIEERKRRKVRLALAASIVTLIGLCSGGWMWISNKQATERIATLEKVRDAIGAARLHRELAKDRDAQARLSEIDVALSDAKRADGSAKLLPEADPIRDQARQLLVQLQREQREARIVALIEQESERLKSNLETIRVSHADGEKEFKVAETANFDIDALEQRYRNAFAEADFDFEQLTVAEAAKKIRRSGISETIISALDHWARSMPKSTQSDVAKAWMSAGNWKAATRAYETRVLQDSGDSIAWMGLAATQAISGDMEAYRRTCDRMLELFADSEESRLGERAAKMCLLFPDQYDPDTLPTETFVREMDEDRVSSPVYRVWYTNCRAMLEYRRKNPEAGLQYVNAVLNDPYLQNVTLAKPYAVLVKAMCEHDLGQESGRDSLAQSRTLIEKLIANPRRRGLHDTAIDLILYREASEKIAPGEETSIDFENSDSISLASLPPVIRRERLRPYLLQVANAADGSQWRQSIRKALEEDDEGALIKLANTDEATRQPPEISVWMGTALRAAGRSELATKILRAAQEQHHADFWLNYQLAKILVEDRQWEDAIGFARTALAIRPSSNAAFWTVVQTLDDMGKPKESLKLFKQMLSRRDMTADHLARLAEALRLRGRLKQSEAAAEKAISRQPDHVKAYEELGRCLLTQERFDDAVSAARKSVSFLPDSAEVDDAELEKTARDAYFSLAYVLAGAEMPEKSVMAYRKCLQFAPDYYAAYNNLGLQLRALDRLDEAEKAFRAAFENNPSSRHTSQNLLDVLRQLTRERGPRPDWQADIERLSRLSQVNRERQIAEYRRVLARNDRDAETHRLLAAQLLRTYEIQEAEIHAAKAAELEPGFETFLLYSQALNAVDKTDEAGIQLRKAVAAGLGREEAGIKYLNFAVTLHNHAVGRSDAGVPLPPLGATGPQLEEGREWFIREAIKQYELGFASDGDDDLGMIFQGGYFAALNLAGRTDKADEVRKEIRAAILARVDKPLETLQKTERFVMVRTLRTLGLENEAVELIQKLNKAFPDDIGTARQTALLLRRAGRPMEAISVGRKLIELHPQDAAGYLAVALTHQGEGDYADAHSVLDEGIEVLSKVLPQAQALERRGQRPTGRANLPRQRRLPNGRPTASGSTPVATGLAQLRQQKAIVYYNENRFEEAVTEHQAAKSVGGAGGFYNGLCLALYELNDLEGAIKNAKEGLSGTAPTAPNALAWLYCVEPDSNGEFPHATEAVLLARRAVDHVALTGNPAAVFRNTLGLAYYRVREYDAALRELKLSVQEIDTADNWLALALTHWQLKNYDESREWLAKAEEKSKQEPFRRAQRNLLAEARQLVESENSSAAEPDGRP